MATEDPQGQSGPKGQPETSSVEMLDQALWSQFDAESELSDFARTWLALLIRRLGNVAAAAVVLRNSEEGTFAPLALWPQDVAPQSNLTEVIDLAIEHEVETSLEDSAVACPLVVDGTVVGAVGLTFQNRSDANIDRSRSVLWGTGWLMAAIRRDLMTGAARESAKVSSLLELIGVVLDANGFEASSLAAANLLVRRLECDQVAIGFLKANEMKVTSLSDVAEVRLGTDQIRGIGRAMTEATDQEGSILYPEREGQDFMISLGHEELFKLAGSGEILTVPLFAHDKVIGAIQFQKPVGQEFADGEVMVAEAAASTLGPVLFDQKQLDRSVLSVLKAAGDRQVERLFGSDYPGRKLVGAVLLVLIAFFSVAKGDYRISSEAEMQGQIVRSMVAPFDGHIDEQFAREGDILKAGQSIATLDVRDLTIELLRWTTDMGRYQNEYDKALEERNASAAGIARANIVQSNAKADLTRLQLDRAELKVPFDALVISGDLSQSLGSAVRRGDELYRIAPLEKYRVELEVDESQLDEIAIGQKGKLVLTSLPGEMFDVEVIQITPRLDARGGKNVALVEATVSGPVEKARPGMRGVAKVYVERRRLIRIWVQPVVDWMRMAIWRWTP